MLKWYVDRITEAERQEHIQEVLKVTPDEASWGVGVVVPRGTGPSAQTGVGGRSLHPKELTCTLAAAELGTLEGTHQACPLTRLGGTFLLWVPEPLGSGLAGGGLCEDRRWVVMLGR